MQRSHSFHVLLTSLSLITSAAAHGWIHNVTVNGKVYPGNGVAQNVEKPFQSVIRQKYTDSPVVSTRADAKVESLTDLTSSDLACGPRAKTAPLSANVAAGDTMTIAYKSDYYENSTHWPHVVGPIMTYLADCGDVTCDKFDVATAEWFKIDQQGKNKAGNWPAQAAIAAGLAVQVTIPANLHKGNYILRHEVVNLERSSIHITEFYPNCVHTIISGSGTGRPTTGETVKFPGAYRATDKDIAYYDPYTDKTAPYRFPGPLVAAFVAGGTQSAGTNPGSNPTSTPQIKSVPPKTAPGAERNTQTSTSTPAKLPSTSTVIRATSAAAKPKAGTTDDREDGSFLTLISTSTERTTFTLLNTHTAPPPSTPKIQSKDNGDDDVSTTPKETISTQATISTNAANDIKDDTSATPSDVPSAGIGGALGSESSAARSHDRGFIAISLVVVFWAFYPFFAHRGGSLPNMVILQGVP